MFEDSQTSKQGWMNKINNEDFRQEFFGHQKRVIISLYFFKKDMFKKNILLKMHDKNLFESR